MGAYLALNSQVLSDLAQFLCADAVAFMRCAGNQSRLGHLFCLDEFFRRNAGQITHLQADEYIGNTGNCFLTGQQSCVAQDTSRASDAVKQSVLVLASELFACLFLLIDDLGCGGDEFIDDCVFAETQSDLVGNLS